MAECRFAWYYAQLAQPSKQGCAGQRPNSHGNPAASYGECFSIQVTGDLAMAAYWVTFKWLDRNGQGVAHTLRVTHAWLRTGNDWRIIGGMSMPEPGTPRKPSKVWRSLAAIGQNQFGRPKPSDEQFLPG